MSTPTVRPRKGLADIRTRTAGASPEQSAYRSCFVMGALELEKMRRLKERQIAAQRIAAIDERLRQIDAEIDSLQRALKAPRLTGVDRVGTAGVRIADPAPTHPKGLRLKY